MERIINLIGIANILLAVFFGTFFLFMNFTIVKFATSPTIILPFAVLLIGGIGVLKKWKIGWTLNQLATIYILVSHCVGSYQEMIVSSEHNTSIEPEDSYWYPLVAFYAGFLILLIISLIKTNKSECLRLFGVQNAYRFIVLSFSIAIAILLQIKKYG